MAEKASTSKDTAHEERSAFHKICKTCFDFKEFARRRAAQEKKDQASQPTDTAKHECPLGIRGLGVSSWNFLHTLAAYYGYDEEEGACKPPTMQDKTKMTTFLGNFAQFYPCTHCREDFIEYVKDQPPAVKNADDLSQWMCGLHNSVNKKLGKEQFDCSRVNERWRDGPKDGRCDGVDGGL